MKFQKNLTKKISFILIVSILSLNLSFLAVPKKADALFGVGDITFSFDAANFGEMIYEFGKKVVSVTIEMTAKTLARNLVQKITEATVNWINGGFNGNPAFISDFGKFMLGNGGVVDRTVGDFFADSSLSFLCDPFRVQVSLALSLEYSSNFQNRIGCTFSGIVNNINNAQIGGNVNVNVNGTNIVSGGASKFLSEGGWDSWLRTTLLPQNNPIGAYLIAKNELDTRIATAQNTKTLELTAGQGALSFKRCIDTYTYLDGHTSKSSEYTDGYGSRPQQPHNTIAEQNCVVKTPGTTITTMLGFKATSDQRTNELLVATTDGIDAIFGALTNALINKAINTLMKKTNDQLQNGVLDPNYDSNGAYDSFLYESWVNAMDDANSDLSDLNNRWTNTINDPYYSSGSDFASPTLPDIIYGTTTWDWHSSSTGAGTIPTGNSGYSSSTGDYVYITPTGSYIYSTSTDSGPWNPYPSIPAYDVLGNAKKSSTGLLNSLSKAEWTYQDTYKFAQKVLLGGKNVFASSSICNMNANRNDYTLRSLIIRSNVTTNIDGVPDSNRTIASIPWNLKMIEPALAKSAVNLAILNKAASDVNSASSIATLNDAMVRVNSTAFHTDPEIKMVENIKTWLRGVRDMYNAPLCPIDLTKVLQITSATSTIN